MPRSSTPAQVIPHHILICISVTIPAVALAFCTDLPSSADMHASLGKPDQSIGPQHGMHTLACRPFAATLPYALELHRVTDPMQSVQPPAVTWIIQAALHALTDINCLGVWCSIAIQGAEQAVHPVCMGPGPRCPRSAVYRGSHHGCQVSEDTHAATC